MTREELTTWLRSFQTPSTDAAADLLDQQAVRIAKLEARADAAEREWGLCEQQRVKAYWRGRRDGWIEGRDAAAETAKNCGDTWSGSRDVEVCLQEAAADQKCAEIVEAIRALTPPETRS